MIRNVADELRIFESINHAHLINHFGVEIHREEMLIFMEYCPEVNILIFLNLNWLRLLEEMARMICIIFNLFVHLNWLRLLERWPGCYVLSPPGNIGVTLSGDREWFGGDNVSWFRCWFIFIFFLRLTGVGGIFGIFELWLIWLPLKLYFRLCRCVTYKQTIK